MTVWVGGGIPLLCFLVATRELLQPRRSRGENIKIAKKDIFSFEFFAPWNQFFLEGENFQKCQKNQNFSRMGSLKSSLGLLAAR